MSNSTHSLSGLPPSLHNDDEALAIENAIREAVNTVMKVIRGACGRRMLEYQRMVADRDQEIRRLECKLEKSESELEVVRLEVGRNQPEGELSYPDTFNAEEIKSNNNQLKKEPAVRCCGVGAAAPSQVFPKCHDTVEAFPHQHARTETSPREGEGPAGGQFPGCITPLVKEEPSDLVIKWEVCEGSLLDGQEGQAENPQQEKPTRKEKKSRQRTCSSCKSTYNVGAKTCPSCGAGKPYKARSTKRLEAFKAKSQSWAEAIRRNRNMSRIRDDAQVVVEKLKALGMQPLLLLRKYDKRRKTWSAECLCPYDLPHQAKAIIEKIEILYKALLEGWTASGEDSLQGESRKRKREGPAVEYIWEEEEITKRVQSAPSKF